ncbi:hypothetical protein ACFLU5_15985 [Bacteroidota bacterium]
MADSRYKQWKQFSLDKKITVYLDLKNPGLKIKGKLTGVTPDSIQVAQKWIQINQIRQIEITRIGIGILFSVVGIGSIAGGASIMDEQMGVVVAYPLFISGSVYLLYGVYKLLSPKKIILHKNRYLVAVKKNQ